MIKVGAFDKINEEQYQHEWIQHKIWSERNISYNVIGIHLLITKHDCYSGDVNM